MIRLGRKEEVEQYFNDSALSQSFLKKVGKGITGLSESEKEMYYKEKGHLIIGSAVDDKISMGLKQFTMDYYITGGKKPSDTIMSMVKLVFDQLVESVKNDLTQGKLLKEYTLHDLSVSVLASADHHKYQSRWKEETRVNKVMEEGYEYFEELKDSYGKQILSVTEAQIVENIEMSWRTNPFTAPYFVDSPDVSIFYQVPIYFNYKGVECKVLLDQVTVNTKLNILQPLDMKTMAGDTLMFTSSAKRFGYNFQGAFYTEAIKTLINSPEDADTIPELVEIINKDTKILPFKFMVENNECKVNKLTEEVTYGQGKPLMFTLSAEQLLLGKEGRPECTYMSSHGTGETLHLVENTQKEIIGFDKAIELTMWYVNNGWDLDKKVVEAKGDILI